MFIRNIVWQKALMVLMVCLMGLAMSQAGLSQDRVGGKILWDTSHGIYISYSPSGSYSDLTSVLTSKGYTVDENMSGVLSLDLSQYEVIVVCLLSAWSSAYTTSEVTAIANFVSQGGGLLILGDNSGCPNANVNPVAQNYGTTLGVSDVGTATLTNLSTHTIFQGVSGLYVNAAGEISAVSPSSAQAWDGSGNPLVAAAEPWPGRVVAVGDGSWLENAFLYTSSNQLFAENVFDWLADARPPWSVNGWASVESSASISGLLLYGNSSTEGIAGLPACWDLATEHYLCHYHSNSRWWTGVVVANPDATMTANVTLTAYDSSGTQKAQTSLTVPPHGKVSQTIETLFGPGLGSGWILVDSDISVVAFDVYGDSLYGGMAALPSSDWVPDLILPHFKYNNKWWTGISVVNPVGSSAANVTITAYDNAGSMLAQSTHVIPPQGKLSGQVQQLVAVAKGQEGWLQVSSDVDVAGILVYGDNTSTPAQMAALPACSDSTLGFASTFEEGMDWWTGISVVNPSASVTANVELRAQAPDGLDLDTTCVAVGPRCKLVGTVTSLFSLIGDPEGWVEIVSDEPVVGLQVLHGDDDAHQAWGLAAVPSQKMIGTQFMTHYNCKSSWWTRFALANPAGGYGAQPTMRAYDEAGVLCGTAYPLIPANGRVYGDVRDFFGIPY